MTYTRSSDDNNTMIEIPGVICQRLPESGIFVYQLTSLHERGNLDKWAKLIVETIRKWSEDEPYLALHDISIPRVGLGFCTMVEFDIFNLAITALGWSQVKEILHVKPNFNARIAVLFGLSSTAFVGRLATQNRFLHAINTEDIQYRSFIDRETALGWLAKGDK